MRFQITHGHRRPGHTSRTYSSWTAMKKRCYYKKHPHYALYGGRGIQVCQQWLKSFAQFLKDVGERPEGMTLDRIDGDGQYEPGNCRWATPKTQIRNSRLAKLTIEQVCTIREQSTFGETGNTLAARYGVRPSTISKILRGQRWAA